MPTLHPSSAGLRQLADFLDNCAEEGIVHPGDAYIYFNAPWIADRTVNEQELCAAMQKRVGGKIEMPKELNEYSDASLVQQFPGVRVTYAFRAKTVCEAVTEMRPVTVYRCNGVEVMK